MNIEQWREDGRGKSPFRWSTGNEDWKPVYEADVPRMTDSGEQKMHNKIKSIHFGHRERNGTVLLRIVIGLSPGNIARSIIFLNENYS